MMNLETCKLRYCRPSETDWHFEQVTMAEASLRKQTLEQMGCRVEMISASAMRARLGALLDPKPLMH